MPFEHHGLSSVIVEPGNAMTVRCAGNRVKLIRHRTLRPSSGQCASHPPGRDLNVTLDMERVTSRYKIRDSFPVYSSTGGSTLPCTVVLHGSTGRSKDDDLQTGLTGGTRDACADAVRFIGGRISDQGVPKAGRAQGGSKGSKAGATLDQMMSTRFIKLLPFHRKALPFVPSCRVKRDEISFCAIHFYCPRRNIAIRTREQGILLRCGPDKPTKATEYCQQTQSRMTPSSSSFTGRRMIQPTTNGSTAIVCADRPIDTYIGQPVSK